MKKTVCLLLLCGTASLSYADLQLMTEDELQAVDGQAGADISLEMRLNQLSNYGFDATLCADFEYCRFALNLNNRNDDGSYKDNLGVVHEANGSTAGATLGKKLWLVFKQVQGTIKFQLIKLDGSDLTSYIGKNSSTVLKAAVQLGFDASKPVLIRNFGYQSLAIEADTVDNEGAGNLPGYLAKSGGGSGAGAYANGKYTAAGFDQGREVGFTGLNVNANLALQGTVKIFSCDTNHPRC
jgi:hypothetical protein